MTDVSCASVTRCPLWWWYRGRAPSLGHGWCECDQCDPSSQFSFPQSDLTRGCSGHTRANSPLMWARDKDNNLPVMIRINGLMSFFWISSPFTWGIYIMTSLDKIMVTTHQNSNNLPSARSLISRPSHIYNKSLAHPALIKTYVWLIISETINLYKICKICVGTPCSNIDISLINQ